MGDFFSSLTSAVNGGSFGGIGDISQPIFSGPARPPQQQTSTPLPPPPPSIPSMPSTMSSSPPQIQQSEAPKMSNQNIPQMMQTATVQFMPMQGGRCVRLD